jgi:hypothetical protein
LAADPAQSLAEGAADRAGGDLGGSAHRASCAQAGRHQVCGERQVGGDALAVLPDLLGLLSFVEEDRDRRGGQEAGDDSGGAADEESDDQACAYGGDGGSPVYRGVWLMVGGM